MLGILGFLGFIIILIIFIVFIALAFLGNIVRSIFGFGKRAPKHFYGEQTDSSSDTSSNQTSNQSTTTSSAQGKKKIFGDDEGEYVEFEEVK